MSDDPKKNPPFYPPAIRPNTPVPPRPDAPKDDEPPSNDPPDFPPGFFLPPGFPGNGPNEPPANPPPPKPPAPPTPPPAPKPPKQPPAPAKPVRNREKELAGHMAELGSLIGMENVKRDVAELKSMVRFRKARKAMGLKTSDTIGHLVFTGNPGTGKTTVARLIGKIYEAMEILPSGHLVEVDREGLVAGYVGQTALKTKAVIDRALGGVLFIDEAYSLSPLNSDKDFGQEAIATILKAMEDYREDIVVIFAGYPDLMRNFIESNPGLKSRCNKYFHFEDYDGMELLQIFDKISADNGFKATKEAREAVGGILTRAKLSGGKNFGNGRTVRNMVEKIEQRLAARLDREGAFDPDRKPEMTIERLTTIMPEDLKGLEDEYIPQTVKEIVKRPIGFELTPARPMGFPKTGSKRNTPAPEIRP